MKYIIFLLAIVSLVGCQTLSQQATSGGGSQLQVRQFQTKKFDNLSKTQALRASIATLQDLEFVVDKADFVLGSVTATKLTYGVIKISVIVRKTKNGVTIRANARQGKNPLSDPKVYQNFFTALDKSIFLVKNEVD